MHSTKQIIKTALFLLCVISLSACSLQQVTQTVPPVQPTQNIDETLNAVRTQAVQTSEAQQASQPTDTSLPPTATLAATATTASTETPLPTATSVPATSTPTRVTTKVIYPTYTPGNTGTPKPWGCVVTAGTPKDFTRYDKNADWDATWTLKNTGANSWGATDVDYSFVSGATMHRQDVYNLGSTINKGESVTVVVDMKAPDTSGTYKETWKLNRGSMTLCTMSVTIIVN